MAKKYTDMHQLPLIMTAEEVADVLGIGRSKAYELLNSQGFPAIRLGRRMVVPRDRFLEWLDAAVA